MALGFRKSLFGYNQEDVAEYINKQSIKHTEIQTELNSKISISEQKINELTAALSLKREENKKILSELEFYREKYEEVKTLSDNIGKLYLVAQTNAKAIMSAANEAKSATDSEIKQNISAIDAANEALNIVKNKINALCDSFTNDVDNLNKTLLNTKAIIENTSAKQEERSENFEKVYSKL